MTKDLLNPNDIGVAMENIDSIINALQLSIADLNYQVEMANQHYGSTYQFTWRIKELRAAIGIMQTLKEQFNSIK